MNIYILHPPTLNNATTYLSADVSPGTDDLVVKNTSGFAEDKFAVVGTIGFEQAELFTIDSVTPPDGITATSNFQFPHNADDKVVQVDFDQIKIYRSTTGINGTYSLLGDPIDIDFAHDVTTFTDEDPETNYYYKFAYFNSVTSDEDTPSDPIASTGFVFYSKKTMTDRVLSLYGDARAQFISRDEVGDWLTEIYEKAQRDLAVATKRLNITTQIIELESNVYEYELNASFLMEKAIKVSTDGGTTYPFTAASMQVDSVGSIVQNNIRYGYYIQGNTLILDNTRVVNANDKLKVYYVPTPYSLSNQTDVVISPFVNATSMFVKYALGMAHLKSKTQSGYDMWEKLTGAAKAEVADFISYVKKMQNLHLQYTELTDGRFI